jgi:uncharacterized membrane protein YjdF
LGQPPRRYIAPTAAARDSAASEGDDGTMAEPEPPPVTTPDRARRIHLVVLSVLQVIMATEFALVLWRGEWLTAILVLAIIGITLAPALLGNRLPVRIPPEFQVLAVVFVFATLFLGEVRSWYERIWWWDIGLHASSGLLLGLVGFLLVYVLNESARVDVHMRPRFVALFAFVFAVATGALWEILEFAMDRLFGTTMQKPMLGDPSGLTDTMWDLILDTAGASAISAFGWWYMRNGERSFIEAWIHKFIARNPHMFRQ